MTPLEGILVLDLTRNWAGPLCTMHLADLGAEVIKVERPPLGDPQRYWGPFGDEGHSLSSYFANRGKKSITLNLKEEKGREVFLKLIKRSDVLVENFRPGVMKRLQFDYETVAKLNPRLVYCSTSGFGQYGPYRDRSAYDPIILGAAGLISSSSGTPLVTFGLADYVGGMFGAHAVVVALLVREKTGIGQYIDLSMLDATLGFAMGYDIMLYSVSGRKIPDYLDPIVGGYPLGDGFKAKDGYVMVGAPTQGLWKRLCQVTGLDELVDDPRFVTGNRRIENRKELLRIFNGVFAEKDGEEWIKILSEAGIPCGPVNTIDKIVSDPHVLAREMVVEMEHPIAGKIMAAGIPNKFSGTPQRIRTKVPLVGEHTYEILRRLGYSDIDAKKIQKASS